MGGLRLSLFNFMIIKKLEHQSPKAKIWDASQKKILFTFVDGEYETNDEYILAFWANKFDSSVSVPTEGHEQVEVKPKRRGRPKKKAE